MSKLGWFSCGALSLLAIAVGTAALLLMQARGLSAREQPTALERWTARRARDIALPREARSRTNPIPPTPEVLAEARAHWADHCASCHSNDGSGDSLMGKRMYPPAPDMRLPATQTLSDGELFYIIENGIRLTGMPSWGGTDHDSEDSWKLVHFIRHLPRLTLEERKEMEQLNPKGPDDRKEEEEEEKFLKGESTDAPQQHHHH